VCHIEAAMPGGERFNINKTNEERRAFDNSMLMCHEHHVITDDVEKYTVKLLKEMKRNQEEKFTDIIEKISDSIRDHTSEEKICIPKTLRGMTLFFEWGLGEDEIIGNIAWVESFANKLKKLPKEARKLLHIIFERSVESNRGFITFETPVVEIIKICKININIINENKVLLEKYRLCFFGIDFDGIEMISINDERTDGLWKYLKDYCQAKSISLYDIIVDLRFDLLD